MDPLSITAASVTLVGLCIKVSATLYDFIDGTRNVDSHITGLYEEILGLSRVQDAIEKTWKQSRLIAFAQADPDGVLWSSVKASIDECQKTLSKLAQELDDIQRVRFFGRWGMRKPTKQINLSLKMPNIQKYRQQMQSYASGMQSALQMINICLLVYNQSSQESVATSLQELKRQITRLEASIQAQSHFELTSTDRREEQAAPQALHRLAEAAERFHSAASARSGSSMMWASSASGDAWAPEQDHVINGWLRQSAMQMETLVAGSDETPLINPQTESSGDNRDATRISPVSKESDTDSDSDSELAERWESLAETNVDAGNYAKAAMFYHKIIETGRLDNKSAKSDEINTKIAVLSCFQNHWDDAEALVLSVVKDKHLKDVTAFHVLHALAIRRVRENQAKEAIKLCRKAIGGKKRLIGRVARSYFESVALLVCVYRSQDAVAEAEGWQSAIPSYVAFQLESEFSAYLSGTLLGNKVAENLAPDVSLLIETPETNPTPSSSPLGMKSISDDDPSGPLHVLELDSLRTAIHSCFGVMKPQRKSKLDFRLVIGIDYGTRYTSVAIAMVDNNIANLEDISLVNNWGRRMNNQKRVPSTISYSPSTDGQRQWGSDLSTDANVVEYTKSQLGIPDNHCEALFLLLYTIESMKNLSFNAIAHESATAYTSKRPEEVLHDYMDRLFQALAVELDQSCTLESLRHGLTIDIVATVPADWTNIGRETLLKAVNAAAVERIYFPPMKDIVLRTEREAAVSWVVRDALYRNLGILSAGDCIVMCNAEIDFAETWSYRILQLQPLEIEQLGSPSTRRCKIKHDFKQWLRSVLGSHWQFLEPNWESESIVAGTTEGVQFRSIMQDFRAHIDAFDPHEKLHYYIKLPGKLARVSRFPDLINGELRIAYARMKKLLDPSIDSLHTFIHDQIALSEYEGRRVSKIFMVGELSRSEHIFGTIKNSMAYRDINCHRPSESETVTALGAAIHGIEHFGGHDEPKQSGAAGTWVIPVSQESRIEEDMALLDIQMLSSRGPSSQMLHRLRELIHTRYALDIEIHNSRYVPEKDRPIVQRKMKKSDDLIAKIIALITAWESFDDDVWDEDEWQLAREVQRRLNLRKWRLWGDVGPWVGDGTEE